MKKVSLLFLISLAALHFGCAEKTIVVNSNQTNVNAPTTQANQTIANVKVEETPLPTFTSADDALTEGKKLLDALETEKAIDALSQAVKLNPDLAEAHFNLGIAYALVEKDEQEKATTQIEPTPTPKAAKTTKKNKKEVVVRTKNSEKAFDNAVKAYKKILAKTPKDDAAQFNLGRAYNKLNEDDDAVKALREAVKLKPDDAEYQIEYAAILMKLAKYEDAVGALKKAISLDDSNLQAQEMLEKAEAGQKRIDFGNKPKLPPQPEQAKPRKTPKPDDSPEVKTTPAPEKKNTNQ